MSLRTGDDGQPLLHSAVTVWFCQQATFSVACTTYETSSVNCPGCKAKMSECILGHKMAELLF